MMILARVHDGSTPWPVVGVFAFISAAMLMSAFFPNWNAKWGGRHSRSTVPMSVLGRIVFGSMAACGAIVAAFNSTLAWEVGFPVYVILLIATGCVAARDSRNYKKTCGDERKEN
jgi:hypothetical protein